MDKTESVKVLARQRIGRGDIATAIDGLIAFGREEALARVREEMRAAGVLDVRAADAIERARTAL